VRKLCPNCKEAYEPTQEVINSVNLKADLIYKPKGCVKCNNTGYKGRACISEVMVLNEQIRDLISQKATFQKIREVARISGMQTLYESGIKKVESGVTSLEEIFSITLGAD
jgi:type II secretory ATPase GspE/PulE/Tfp pilus assembly ATPase PilB-like protein